MRYFEGLAGRHLLTWLHRRARSVRGARPLCQAAMPSACEASLTREMLKGGEDHPEVSGLLNVEDEVYVAAVLGCTMGVLRHPLEGVRPGPDTDLFFNGPRRAKRRMDEVVRALRWQRLAQPFSPGSGTVKVSEDVLTDSWR